MSGQQYHERDGRPPETFARRPAALDAGDERDPGGRAGRAERQGQREKTGKGKDNTRRGAPVRRCTASLVFDSIRAPSPDASFGPKRWAAARFSRPVSHDTKRSDPRCCS